MKIAFTITIDIDEENFRAKAGEDAQATTGDASADPVSRAAETSRQKGSIVEITDGCRHGGNEEPAAADRHAPIQESPRKAAEAVPERAAYTVATIATITDAIAQATIATASDSAKSAGEAGASVLPTNSPNQASTGAVTGLVDPPSTQTGSSDHRDVLLPLTSGQTSVTVVGSERGTVFNSRSVGAYHVEPTAPAESEADVISAPVPNERCRRPDQCRFSRHPQKVTCSECGSAWMARKEMVAA